MRASEAWGYDPVRQDVIEVLSKREGRPLRLGVQGSSSALRVPAVLQAVRLVSETVGSLPCKLYSEEDGSKEAVKDHPAYKLVHRRANEWTSAGQLRIDLTADALLHGAGFAQVIRVGNGEPYELHRLAPGTVQRRFEDDGESFWNKALLDQDEEDTH